MSANRVMELASAHADPAASRERSTADLLAERWMPHEHAWLEHRFFSFARKRSKPRRRLLDATARLQWRLSQPLLRRAISTKYVQLTWGELLFMFLAIAVPAAAGILSWNSQGSTGSIAEFAFAVAFLLPMRNSVWAFVLGLPFERAIFWHNVASLITLALSLEHGLNYYIGDDPSQRNPNPYQVYQVFTGWLIFAFLGAIVLTSITPIRRKLWEVWHVLHWVLLISIAIACIYHNSAVVTVVGVGIVIHYIVRLAVARFHNSVDATADALPGDVVRLTLPGDQFDYLGGQYVWICVPELTMFQWHPFSISSSPGDRDITLHIRVLGGWTKGLYKLVAGTADKNKGEVGTKRLKVWVEGPHGKPQVDIWGDRYRMVLLVSGGIGITPMQSICNTLLKQSDAGRPLKKVFFVWSVRDRVMMDAVRPWNTEYARENLPDRLPMSFQPDYLARLGQSRAMLALEGDSGQSRDPADLCRMDDDVLHTEFYLTKPGSASRAVRRVAPANGAGGPGAEGACQGRVVVRGTCKECRVGRPDMDLIIARMGEGLGLAPVQTHSCAKLFGHFGWRYSCCLVGSTLLGAESRHSRVPHIAAAMARAHGERRVAVLACGPTALLASTRAAAIAHSRNGVVFDFHEESFEL